MKKMQISKLIHTWVLGLLISISLIYSAVNYYFDYTNFKTHASELRQDFIENQKGIVKNQVLRVTQLINYEKSQTEKKAKLLVKNRVDDAYSIMTTIYNKFKNKKSDVEIKKMIVDILRPIRFNNNHNYYFINDKKGKAILYPTNLQLEGSNILNLKDSHGDYVVKKQKDVIKKFGEGFTIGYWPKPNSKSNQKDFKKISYVKLFKPYNWTIGTGLYLDDLNRAIQEDILNEIKKIHYSEHGYIFIIDGRGNLLVSKWKRYSGKKKIWEVFNQHVNNSKKIYDQIIEAGNKPNGDYIYYLFNKSEKSSVLSKKSSYVKKNKDWNWYIGTGFYLDDVQSEIDSFEKQFRRKLLNSTISTFFFIIIAFLFFLLLSSRISKKIQKDFLLLISFFKKAALSNKPIDRRKIRFCELDIIAKNANKMLLDKIAAEKKLLDERERLFVTIRSIGDAVITTDTDRKITLMNNVAENLLGFKNEEVIGKNLKDVFKIFNNKTNNEIRNPIYEIFNHKKTFQKNEGIKLVSKNGKEYQISVSASPIKDSENNVLGAILVFRDITEELKLKNDIKKNEIKFRTITEQSPISTMIFDANGTLLVVNKAWEKLWDAKAEDIIGKYNIFEDEAIKDTNWMNVFKKTLKGETVSLPDSEYNPEISGISGRTRYIRAVAFPIIDEEKIDRLVLIHQDITELKRAEEKMLMMSKLKSVGTLAGGIAHDFNNILTGIFGNISLAKLYTPENTKVARYLMNAENSINRAVRLTKQLLIFSKGGTPVKESIDVKKVIEEVVNFDLSGSSVKAIFEEEENLWNIFADKGQIQQVFSNLAINANQAMPKGGNIYFRMNNIEIDENNDLGMKPGKYVKIEVQDEGIGIKKEDIKKIFDPYFTTKSTGNGLGLATSYSIIQKHNGYIGIESELGKGTIFTIFLPATEKKKNTENKEKAEQIQNEKFIKVLIMDDEQMICNLASDMVKTIGFQSEVAFDGKEAIEKYRKAIENNSPFDLIIMDLTIPGGMGGEQAIKHILKINPEAKVIVSSGYSNEETLSSYKKFGFVGIIAKPYTIEKLKKGILTALN